MGFSEELKEARAQARLSQQALAELIKVPKRTYESWEMGERVPPMYAQLLVLEKVRSLAENK